MDTDFDIEISAITSDMRRTRRHPVSMFGRLDQPEEVGAPVHVLVENISRLGACVTASREIHEGEELSLMLKPGHFGTGPVTIKVRVARTRGYTAGLTFEGDGLGSWFDRFESRWFDRFEN